MKKQVYNRRRLKEIITILRKYNVTSGITPKYLTLMLEDLGPTFVKLGQIMSMQSGILPIEYCEELSKLRTNVTPIPFSEVKEILEMEYKTSINKIFLKIEADPIGSASIAQVHKAVLKDNSNVVVKIQRKGIYETMFQDVILLKKASGIIKFVAKIGNEIDLNMIIDEMWNTTKQELNFLIEAKNAAEFYENNSDVVYITCPKINVSYSTSKVLVMEYIDGFPIDNKKCLIENGYNVDEIINKLAINYIKQIIEDGFFHADPHTGNILIRDGKIVWIDLGMIGRLNSRDKKLLSSAVEGIASNDIDKLTDFALNMGVYDDKIDRMLLSSDIEILLNKYGTMDFNDMDLVQLIGDFNSTLKQHKISIPKGISMLGRGISTIQGTLRTLNPEVNFINIIVNYISSDKIKHFNIKDEIQSIFKTVNLSFKKSLDIPLQISDTLKIFSKGFSKLNMELNMSNDTSTELERMVNKITISIVTAALLIGSSLICTTNMTPKVLGIPALGFFGFITAFLLGGWIFYTIVRKK